MAPVLTSALRLSGSCSLCTDLQFLVSPLQGALGVGQHRQQGGQEKVPRVEEEKRGGRDDEESRGGRTRVEERGVSGEGRSEGRRGGGRGGALSLREEETESQLDRRDEERRENSALNCHRLLHTPVGGGLQGVAVSPQGDHGPPDGHQARLLLPQVTCEALRGHQGSVHLKSHNNRRTARYTPPSLSANHPLYAPPPPTLWSNQMSASGGPPSRLGWPALIG
ncbi:hypothetical protein EYF80_020205 [Liparis tanakae]|uniref:Uncharacterized protein n=1 Tax=Liparis tanakae TaxID=230148 RepID=A0A4Z2HVB2_9TELE|nr:hypothetical protein EYF80_020205 [Liparis tanakae]